MARFNEILVGRYNRLAQKLFSMKGGPVAAQLASELTLAFPFFNGAENRYLEGWNRFGVGVNTGIPGAGNRAAVRIRNPATSNVIAVLEKLAVVKATTASTPNLLLDSIATAMNAEGAPNLVRPFPDARTAQQGSAMIVTSTANFGIVGTIAGYFAATATVGYDYILTDIQEIQIAPNSQVTVADDALADAMLVTLMWRERFLEDSERT